MLKNKITYQYLQLISLILIPWGLFFFEAMASILVIVFAFPLLRYGRIIDIEKLVRCSWPFFIIYGILFFSGFWSRDTTQWMNLLRVNLPYVVLPVAFFLWPDFLRDRRQLFQQQFVWAGAVLSVYMGFYILLNQDLVLQMIRDGGSFLMPVNHVKSGLFLAIACLFAWDELARRRWMSKGYIFYGGLLILIIGGIHLLAVRTGLMLFYAGSFLTFLLNKNFHGRKGISCFFVLALIVILAFFFIPTLGEKWHYFREDIQNYNSDSWWFYSDALRWRTNIVGWEIARSAPWWGVGMGDVFVEMHMRFYNQDDLRIWEYPHQLWITILAGSGIVGLLLLNTALGGLFIQVRRHGTLVFLIVFVIYMMSCLVENTLLTSLGSISFIMILLLATGTIGFETDQSADDASHPPQN